MRTTSLLLCRLSLLVNLASLDAPSQSSADRSTVIRKSVKRLDSTVLSLGYSVLSSFLCKFLIFRHGKNEPPVTKCYQLLCCINLHAYSRLLLLTTVQFWVGTHCTWALEAVTDASIHVIVLKEHSLLTSCAQPSPSIQWMSDGGWCQLS